MPTVTAVSYGTVLLAAGARRAAPLQDHRLYQRLSFPRATL